MKGKSACVCVLCVSEDEVVAKRISCKRETDALTQQQKAAYAINLFLHVHLVPAFQAGWWRLVATTTLHSCCSNCVAGKRVFLFFFLLSLLFFVRSFRSFSPSCLLSFFVLSCPADSSLFLSRSRSRFFVTLPYAIHATA